MSYDIHFRVRPCEHCGHAPEYDRLSPTFNLGAMFRAAIGDRGIYSLHGLTGEQAAPRLEAALAWMGDPANAAAIADMEPSNGWGDSDGARWVLRTMLEWCHARPDGIIDSDYGSGLPEWCGGDA